MSWLILGLAAGLFAAAWRRHLKNREEVADAFGLGITVGREFRKMRDEWEDESGQ